MTSEAMRTEIHHLVDEADEQKLAEIYDLLHSAGSGDKFTAEELAEFEDRIEKYESGQEPGFTVEETFEYLRANRK